MYVMQQKPELTSLLKSPFGHIDKPYTENECLVSELLRGTEREGSPPSEHLESSFSSFEIFVKNCSSAAMKDKRRPREYSRDVVKLPLRRTAIPRASHKRRQVAGANNISTCNMSLLFFSPGALVEQL